MDSFLNMFNLRLLQDYIIIKKLWHSIISTYLDMRLYASSATA